MYASGDESNDIMLIILKTTNGYESGYLIVFKNQCRRNNMM